MPKTNKERLQDNNLELQNIKTGIDSLPDYQDIQPIYATGNFIKVNEFQFTFDSNSTNNFMPYNLYSISFLNNWLVTQIQTERGPIWQDFYLLNMETKEKFKLPNHTPQYTSGEMYPKASIITETDNYVYIVVPSSTNAVKRDFYIYKFNKENKSFTRTTQTITYDVYSDSFRKFYNGDYVLSRNNCLYAKFNLETEQFDFSTKLTSISTIYHLNEFYSSTIGSQPRTLYKWNNINHSSYISKSISGLSGVNWAGTKAFVNGNVYELNQDLSLGTLLKSNAYPFNASLFMYILNDRFIVYDKYLYEFNETTNEFSKFDNSNNYYMADYGKLIKFDSNNLMSFYSFNSTDTQIGFKYLDKFYPNSMVNIISSSKLLVNNAIIDYAGNTISGDMPNNGALNYIPTTSQQTIPAGYTSGGTISAVDNTIDENIVAENIRKDVTILGVTGTVEGGINITNGTVDGHTLILSSEPEIN